MTRNGLITLAMLGSVGLLAGAFLFQFAGFPPCQLCLWQRWPHAAAIVIGVLARSLGALPARIWPIGGALAMLVTAGIGLFHSGVERKWWPGLDSCSGGAGLGTDLLSTEGPMIVPCDQIVWDLFGLSMANYNVLASLLLAGIWGLAALRTR